MRKALAVISILAIAALAAFAPVPKPKQPGFAVSVRAAGTLVWVRWSIAASPSDSLTVDVTGPSAVHRMYVADSKTDSVSYAKPAPTQSIGGSVTGKNWRGTRSATAPAAAWTYVEPDTVVTPPSVNVQVIPSSVTLSPGGTVQFQAQVS